MAGLNDEQKLFAVQHLAAYHSLSEVVDLLKETHGVETTTSQIARYNPLTLAGASLCEQLKAVFVETRKAFEQDAQSIAIAHANYRLRLLDNLVAKNSRNPVFVRETIVEVEKILGGMYQRPKTEKTEGGAGDLLMAAFAESLTRIYPDAQTNSADGQPTDPSV